ncbi:hypothetical protein BaRGS_00003066 [Batillaria attramentaria]|uniref:Uncharacterized protein n=1 Tax=Batillaria attramentaria TaxID=370345 RepID=A0ABD0M234_9CAEN
MFLPAVTGTAITIYFSIGSLLFMYSFVTLTQPPVSFCSHIYYNSVLQRPPATGIHCNSSSVVRRCLMSHKQINFQTKAGGHFEWTIPSATMLYWTGGSIFRFASQIEREIFHANQKNMDIPPGLPCI